MVKKLKISCLPVIFFVATEVAFCVPVSKENNISIASEVQQSGIRYLTKNNNLPLKEKRANPAYDKIIGDDGMYHYRVLFWVPKEASKFQPYADDAVNTNVSSHGPADKWWVQETGTTNGNEKLVFIFVPKTFVYLYGNGFENVIHLKYN